MVSVRTPTGHAPRRTLREHAVVLVLWVVRVEASTRTQNATISNYGSISGNSAMQTEIYRCGPIACGIDAMPLLNWESGIISTAGSGTAHVISIVTRPKRNPLVLDHVP